jgi:hypothetical protein
VLLFCNFQINGSQKLAIARWAKKIGQSGHPGLVKLSVIVRQLAQSETINIDLVKNTFAKKRRKKTTLPN